MAVWHADFMMTISSTDCIIGLTNSAQLGSSLSSMAVWHADFMMTDSSTDCIIGLKFSAQIGLFSLWVMEQRYCLKMTLLILDCSNCTRKSDTEYIHSCLGALAHIFLVRRHLNISLNGFHDWARNGLSKSFHKTLLFNCWWKNLGLNCYLIYTMIVKEMHLGYMSYYSWTKWVDSENTSPNDLAERCQCCWIEDHWSYQWSAAGKISLNRWEFHHHNHHHLLTAKQWHSIDSLRIPM